MQRKLKTFKMLKKNQAMSIMMLYAKIMSLTMPAKAQASHFQGAKNPIEYSHPLKAVSCSFRRPSNRRTFVMSSATPPKRLKTLDMTKRFRTEREKEITIKTLLWRNFNEKISAILPSCGNFGDLLPQFFRKNSVKLAFYYRTLLLVDLT